MKKTQLLFIATLSASLLLAGCGKKKGGESAKESDASESEPEVSYTVTEQEYADEIKHGGFAIDQNVTYAGNSIYGTMEADFAVEIDSNIIHGKMGGAMGLEDYVKIHYDTYDEGFVDIEVYSIEPGADFSAGKYYKENSASFADILTEATYVLPVEYDDLEYNEEKQAYVLKETTTIFVIEGNMKITELEFKFVNGKLDSYKTRFGPEDDERISIYLDLQATKRGETHVEFPVFKEVSENVFNKWIKTLEFFTDLDNSATIEGNIHIYGEDYQIVRKIEENGIESIDYNLEGEMIDHRFYVFDMPSYNSVDDSIDYTVYQYSEDQDKWYGMPYSGNLTNVFINVLQIVPIEFEYLIYDEEKGAYSLAAPYEYEAKTATCDKYDISFLYGELAAYSYSYANDADDDSLVTADMQVKDIGNTDIEMPKIG